MQGLMQEPHFPNAVQWSEDNLVAVAAGSSAVVLNPANLAGPRAHTPHRNPDPEHPPPPPRRYLAAPASHMLGQLLKLRDKKAGGSEGSRKAESEGSRREKESPMALARALAWAPAGSGEAGGCLLTVLYDDGQVRASAQRRNFATELYVE